MNSSIMLSLTRTGTLWFDAEIDPSALPAHLADALRDADASTVEIQGNSVKFTRRMFRFVSNLNVLVPFESGDLTVDSDVRQVRYRVSIRQLALIGTAMVAAMTLFISMSRVWQPLLFMPLMWLWLVGGNVALGIFRFESFLGRAIAKAPHLTQQSARWTHSFPK
jgi:hypothetical protein